MPTEPDPRVLELLRRIDANLDLVAADLRDTIACADRCLARISAVQHGLDRLDNAVGRVERRLGLIDERLGVLAERPGHWQRGL